MTRRMASLKMTMKDKIRISAFDSRFDSFDSFFDSQKRIFEGIAEH